MTQQPPWQPPGPPPGAPPPPPPGGPPPGGPPPGYDPQQQATIPELAAHVVAPETKAPADTLTRSFIGISLRRAYRLHILADEVLPSERAHLARFAPHVRDPEQQAFLAWRRSVLLLVALMFVPLSVSRFLETYDKYHLPFLARAFYLLPAVAEVMFCLVAFAQLKNWANWKKQRRILFIAWAVYFIAPFIVYLFPFRSAFDNYIAGKEMANLEGIPLATKGNLRMLVGLATGVTALLALGPKIISLMPGLIRASIVSKLLFPGSTTPGWLMVLAAPFYALFAYIIVLLPYQITGSWQFLAGNAGVLLAQVFIAISGRRLTEPLTVEESQHKIHRTWLAYILILVVSAGFMVYGLSEFIRELHMSAWRVVSSVLAVISNVLLDTLIGTDAIVAAMAHFRRGGPPDPRREQLRHEAEAKLGSFTA